VSDAAGQPGGTQRTSPRHPRRLVWQREATEEPLPAPEPGILHRARVAAVARWVLLPPWAQALVVFAVSRVIGFLIIDRTGRFQPASIWSGPQPGYLGMVGLWDGDWYHRIADNGYPRILPRNPDGLVAQNEWAFYPLYPYLTRAVMGLTGAGWPLAATITSMLCAAGAVVLIRSVTARVAGPSLAMWTVVLFCCYPAAPVLQLAYAESLSLLVLAGLLWCLQRHRYLLAIASILIAKQPDQIPLLKIDSDQDIAGSRDCE